VPGLSIDLSHIEPPALQALADRAAPRGPRGGGRTQRAGARVRKC